jgi:HAD superfamily hydrolase (TIGR01509 family)
MAQRSDDLRTRKPPKLDALASRWQLALDADERALNAASTTLSHSELARRHSELAEERRRTATALAQLAETTGVRPAPWLAPVAITPQMLGLPLGVEVCLFDLDGVLTDSGVLHALAWAAAFDDFLQRVSERNRWHFIPFDREADYAEYIDGRPRLEGVHRFLDSRGIRLPEGRPGDPADAETAHGLARHKSEAIARSLHRRGVAAVPGARRYLEAAGHAGLRRAIVSSSANALPMLELAGLATLVEARVDAGVIRLEGLRSRPAPDLLLSACRHLGVDPAKAVTFTATPAGIAAGYAAGLMVVAVGEGKRRELLDGFGAQRVVPSVCALLDRRLR